MGWKPLRRKRSKAKHANATGPAGPTLEDTVYGLVTLRTLEGDMVDPQAIERCLKALYPILQALPPDGDLTEPQRHWLAQIRAISDAIGALDLLWTMQLKSATFTPIDQFDRAEADPVR